MDERRNKFGDSLYQILAKNCTGMDDHDTPDCRKCEEMYLEIIQAYEGEDKVADNDPKVATAINVHVEPRYIWPSGELGLVRIRKDFDNSIEMTYDQAESLVKVLQTKLASYKA